MSSNAIRLQVYILKAMAHIPEDKSHFARIYDKVKKNNFYMIVMTLLGKSLGDLKKMRKPAIFRSVYTFYLPQALL